jgi:hypothetical protein
MRSAILGILAAIVLAAAAAGCRGLTAERESGSLPPALPDGAAAIFEAEISEARDLYVAKCAKCHRFYHPAGYSELDWTYWMKKMSRKSRLKPDQEELLSRYLGAFRLVEPPDKPGRPR